MEHVKENFLRDLKTILQKHSLHSLEETEIYLHMAWFEIQRSSNALMPPEDFMPWGKTKDPVAKGISSNVKKPRTKRARK